MPNLLLLCEYPALNGAEMSMLSTLDEVRAAGFHVTVAAPASGPLQDELRRRDLATLPLDLTDASGCRLSPDDIHRRLERLLETATPDLVHANSLAMGRRAGPVAAERGLPSLAHLRDIIKLNSTAIRKLNSHSRLLAVSHATREFHVAAGLDPAKTVVLYNGVDLERFRVRAPTGDLHSELGLPPEAKLVGTVGQISLRKGFDVLLAAAKQIVPQHADAHLVLVGQRQSEKEETRRLERELRRTAASAELSGHVHFLGVRRDIERLLPEFTLLAHPARQEPLGRVLLEAAACGTPLVATEVGGTREIFPSDSAAAQLVPPDDAAALAQAITTLLDDEPARRRLSANARQRVESAFDARRAAAALIEQYREVLRLG